MIEKIWNLTEGEVLESLKTKKEGLSEHEAKLRLVENGLNELESRGKKSKLSIFISNFKSPLIYILIIAGIIALFLNHFIDASIIFFIIIVNALIGYFQEEKAENTIDELKKISALKSVVIRGGNKKIILSTEIVPGDIIELSEGVKIPADARVVEAYGLQVNEASLTGESSYVDKSDRESKAKTINETNNIVYMGTTVAVGRGLAVVFATGNKTEFGKIGEIVADEFHTKTPLQLKLEKFSKQIGFAVLLISIFVYVLGTISGFEPLLMFETAVSLAVSAIPEGLPVAITVILVLGMKRMAKKKAIIRNLSAVETLGTTTVIASDKTGTLTHNKLSVVEVYVGSTFEVTGDGYGLKGDFLKDGKSIKPSKAIIDLLGVAVLTSEGEIKKGEKSFSVLGDPVDAALLVAAYKAGVIKSEILKKNPRTAEIPFSSERKFMVSQNIKSGKEMVFIKGAFEEILKRSDSFMGKKINSSKGAELEQVSKDMAERGLRVLAIAEKIDKTGESLTLTDTKDGFNLLGFVGMKDTYRLGAKQAISICQNAGIKVLMLTGDHLSTAERIGHDLGIIDRTGKAIDVSEFESGSRIKIDRLISRAAVFARIRPKAKYQIIEALKDQGEIVAMTGDGVNDVPALVKADIGVAMGLAGTDAAKEAADMVLTDDNFSAIVNAVEEGRTIFENIRKTIYYLFSTNVGEILTVVGGLLAGMPLVLSPVQILWMNLATDTPAVIPLGMEPSEKDHLKQPPRDPKEHIISSRIIRRTILVGLTMAIVGLLIFDAYLPLGESEARTRLFFFLVICQWFNAFNAKSEKTSILKTSIFNNRYLIFGILISVLFQFLIIFIEPLRNIFGLVMLNFSDWMLLTSLALLIFVVIEVDKFFVRLKK
ncbi:MAG: HAD-IC family P-type ATPase [Patescibacteria group bacterium]|nr:HAD-IC family P-type ATPase [Patescibacteria group bacterium]